MKSDFLGILSSKVTTIVLLTCYILLMAGATFVEKFYGTAVAKFLIYYSPLFIFLHLLLVVNFLLLTIKYKFISQKRYSFFLIHVAFVIILVGAMITHLFSKEGIVHIREGEITSNVLPKQDDNKMTFQLPFKIELKKFKIVRYPGSDSPSSYESYLNLYVGNEILKKKIYMNNVLDIHGYRFFQSSYDPDEKGTILSVNYDATGRSVTYSGYILLFAGLLLMLFDKNSRFRRVWRLLKYKNTYLLVLCLLFFGLPVEAQEFPIPENHAEKFGHLAMQSSQGRIVPLNTFALEVVRKFKLDNIIAGNSADMFLLSVMAYPSDWSLIPLIEVNDKGIASAYGWKQGRIAYKDAFDEKGYYKLATQVEKVYRKNPANRTRHDKELLKLDDRINIFHGLITYQLLRIFPDSTDVLHLKWLSPTKENKECFELIDNYFYEIRAAEMTGTWAKADKILDVLFQYQKNNCRGDLIQSQKLKAEIFYNRLNILHYCKLGYIFLAVFMIAFLSFLSSQRFSLMNRVFKLSFKSALVILFFMHTIALGLRWYISGYAPWSNSYEMMISLAWGGVVCGLIFMNRNYLVAALSTLFAGVVLFVSGLSWMDPQITPLVPVLKSPWLMAHVAFLVMAYGFLGISCMISTSYLLMRLFIRHRDSKLLRQLTLIDELVLILGIAFLVVGIFLGAVWANESWGRYWSWDPKETWALITMIIYALTLHVRWFFVRKDGLLFHILSQFSFLSVIMTFLGVNYFLNGMHSYGNHDALSNIPMGIYIVFFLFFILPGSLAYILKKR